MTEPALIVDDNLDYVKILLKHLEPAGYEFHHAWNAAEGFQALDDAGAGFYSLVVTDITMEGQTAGLKLIRKIRRYGYRNLIMVASTGFDNPFVLWISRFFMRLWRVDILVPKKPLRKGEFRCFGISREGKRYLQKRQNKAAV